MGPGDGLSLLGMKRRSIQMMKNEPSRHTRRVPQDSAFYRWVIPAVFILFAVLLVVIVAFSVGVVTGILHFP